MYTYIVSNACPKNYRKYISKLIFYYQCFTLPLFFCDVAILLLKRFFISDLIPLEISDVLASRIVSNLLIIGA